MRARLALAGAVAGTLLAFGPARAPAGEPPASPPPVRVNPEDLDALLEATAPAVVSLQFLLKYEGGYESTSWAHGVVADPSGLVMLSNGEVAAGDAKLSDIKVLFGNDPKEWESILVARDSMLDLAYVQVLGLEGKTVPAVDFAKTAEAKRPDPRLGAPLYGVTRAGRGFDYAASIRRLYFTCRIESPRRMWDFTGEFGEAGLPVFDMTGAPVAVLVRQASAEGSDEGGGSHTEVFAVPLDPVVKSLEAARKRVPEAVKKAEEAKKEAGKEGEAPKPAEGKPAAPAPVPPKPGEGR